MKCPKDKTHKKFYHIVYCDTCDTIIKRESFGDVDVNNELVALLKDALREHKFRDMNVFIAKNKKRLIALGIMEEDE